MEQLLDALEQKIEMDFSMSSTDVMYVECLAGYDPQDVLKELAKRNPWASYAWEELDGSDYIGRIHFGGYGGAIPMCRCCMAPGDLWWTDMVHDPSECKRGDRTVVRLDQWFRPVDRAFENSLDELMGAFGAMTLPKGQSMEVE